MKRPRFLVMGGAGAMGRIAVKDLVETAPKDAEIVIADTNRRAAQALARALSGGRVKAAFCDVTNIRETAAVLRGTFAVLNCVQHQFNLNVMRACLAAGCHYLDLGGLFHVTRQQIKLHREFKKKRLLALLGIGAAPGIVNILARQGADTLDAVDEIHIYVGNVDRTPGRTASVFGASYSLQTIVEEASSPAAVFTGGKLIFVEAMSGAVDMQFPEPVGLRRPAYTLHSEVATLPLSFKHKGVREVSFRIAFSEELTNKLRFLRTIGMLSQEPVDVGRAKVVPQQLLLRLAREVPPGSPGGPPDEYEVLRVVVRGTRQGERREVVLDCHTPGIREWQLGADVDTGCPPSICAQLLWRGEITARGALPPELAVPVEPFLRELEKRHMTVRKAEHVLPRFPPPAPRGHNNIVSPRGNQMNMKKV